MDGYVYCEITKGMYGLPQSGIIAQELIAERLAEYGYHQSRSYWDCGRMKQEGQPSLWWWMTLQ